MSWFDGVQNWWNGTRACSHGCGKTVGRGVDGQYICPTDRRKYGQTARQMSRQRATPTRDAPRGRASAPPAAREGESGSPAEPSLTAAQRRKYMAAMQRAAQRPSSGLPDDARGKLNAEERLKPGDRGFLEDDNQRLPLLGVPGGRDYPLPAPVREEAARRQTDEPARPTPALPERTAPEPWWREYDGERG